MRIRPRPGHQNLVIAKPLDIMDRTERIISQCHGNQHMRNEDKYDNALWRTRTTMHFGYTGTATAYIINQPENLLTLSHVKKVLNLQLQSYHGIGLAAPLSIKVS